MRIELLYSPGCNTYKKALSTLEHIIAEERLPLPVELVEDRYMSNGKPHVRIDGEILAQLGKKTHTYLDDVHEVLCHKWRTHTRSSLRAN
ncbi:MAG: hypothetical protein JSS83_11905 [Cyanobacteria bacterium SZAS LIN-3]|nr:hypothetical protein [Cyanobacteria bacterium SZAS LIN-3]MBS2006761.1 hypothetical protein [Cyanobacteria bacterium SZAS TMP-1]